MMHFLSLQLKEEQSVHGSDEEVDDPPEADSDEDLSDDTDNQVIEEVTNYHNGYILKFSLFLIWSWYYCLPFRHVLKQYH